MGSKMLKVCSILMIIGAALALVMAIVGFMGLGAIMGAAAGSFAAGFGVAAILMGIASLGAVLQLIAGIMGVKNWDKPQKATGCIVMGIVILVINIISQVGSLMSSQSTGSEVFGIILGLVLPILYLVGAFQLKNQAQL